MQKAELIDLIAGAGLPEGATLAEFELPQFPGMRVSLHDGGNPGALAAMGAKLLAEHLSGGAADIPDGRDLSAVEMRALGQRAIDFLELCKESALLEEVRIEMEGRQQAIRERLARLTE